MIGIFITGIFCTLLVVWFILSQYKILFFTLIVGVVVRINVIVLGTTLITLPDSTYDARRFEGVAKLIYNGWQNGISIHVPTPYAYFVAGIYQLQHSTMLFFPLFMNVIFYVVIAILVFKTVLLLSESKIAGEIAVCIVTLFPMDILYSTLLLREQIIILFLALSYYTTIKFLGKGNYVNLIFAYVFLMLSALFHTGIVILFVPLYIVTILFSVRQQKFKFSLFRLIALGAMGMVFLQGFVAQYGTLKSLNYIMFSRWGTDFGRTGYLSSLIPRNGIEFILYLPIRMVYFLYAPFFWMLSSVKDILVFGDGLLFFLMTAFMILGFFSVKHWGIKVYSLLFFLWFVMIFSIGTSNFGTAMRHRHKILFFCAIWAAIGLRFLVKRYIKGADENTKANSEISD